MVDDISEKLPKSETDIMPPISKDETIKDKDIEITIVGRQEKPPDYKEKEDYPDGDIIEHLALDDPAEDISDIEGFIPPQEGDYYLEGGLGVNLLLQDDLTPADPKKLILVRAVVASDENNLVGANDSYTHAEFKPGDLVFRLGKYNSVISLESLRDLVRTKNKPREFGQADIVLDNEGMVVEKDK